MVNPEVVLEKLRHIRFALKRIAEKSPRSELELFGDPDTQDVVLRNIQNALQGCLDIASHIVADESWGVPTRAAEFFVLLGQREVIGPSAAKQMGQLIRFRNILVHEYTKLDFAKAWDAISAGVPEIESYCVAISEWLEK